MTESEWIAGTHPKLTAMINTVGGVVVPLPQGLTRTTRRKLLLFASACLRRVWPLITDERCRGAVEAAELFADGEVTEWVLRMATNRSQMAVSSLRTATKRAAGSTDRHINNAIYEASRGTIGLDWPGSSAASVAAHSVGLATKYQAKANGWAARPTAQRERSANLALLRCIVGNPFRPVAFDPAWRTSTAVALAEGIYVDRAFDRLPILADALEDAGCDHPDVLAHCRGDGPHARGCWVVDLVLGKA